MLEQSSPARRPEGAESPAWIIVLFASVLLLIGFGIFYNARGGDFTLWLRLLGLIATLAIFTILYKDNPLFRFVEHIFVGLAAGFGLIFIWMVFIQPKWLVPLLPNTIIKGGGGFWSLIFALLLGSLFFTVYFPKISWMNRFAVSVLMGWSAGAALQMFIGGLAPQIVAAFRPPVTTYAPENMPEGMNNFQIGGLELWWHPWALIGVIVLTCTIAYFFFSIDHKKAGWVRVPANWGRYFLMITLGAIFGTTVMGRFSLMIERLDYIRATLIQWFHMLLS